MNKIYIVCKTKTMSDEPVRAFIKRESAVKWVRNNSDYSGFDITEVELGK